MTDTEINLVMRELMCGGEAAVVFIKNSHDVSELVGYNTLKEDIQRAKTIYAMGRIQG